MNLRSPIFPRRRGYSYWPALAFLCGFAILIAFVAHSYLLPALDAFNAGSPKGKVLISGQAALLLALLLIILVSGLLLTFRIGRFFFPRASEKRTQTKYIDAWAEAGKRPPRE